MKRSIFAALCLFSTLTFASNSIKLSGTYDVDVAQNPSLEPGNTIKVMKFALPEKVKQRLKEKVHGLRGTQCLADDGDLPANGDLGMNNAPVLNQGHHGSCVTFANTGAYNAALGKGDYVSQLCNLALGKHFAENGFQFSGWDGSFGPQVLSQMTNFGIINMDNQRKYGCGSLYEYPVLESDKKVTPMPLAKFHERNENVGDKIAWSEIITAYDWLEGEYCPCKFLHEVKRAISEGHRVTFGTLLDVRVGHAGALGQYKSTTHFDTWMLTSEIEEHVKEGTVDAGHELVIYGYDDNAEINGQKGILFIRNSWSENAGYHGDYFMTYDYFKLLAYEGQKIMLVEGKMPPPGK